MYTMQLQIEHKGCWGSEIHQKFPQFSFSSIDTRWIRNQVVHIVAVFDILAATGNSSSAVFDKIAAYLKKRNDVLRVEILSKDKKRIFLRILTKQDKKHQQFSNIFFQNHCFPLATTQFKNKYEVWTLGTADKNNFTIVYNFLKKKYPTKIIYTKKDTIHPFLTQKQQEILLTAKHFSYFTWPRQKTISEICKLVKIPKTVFLSHLRKAENKIIESYFSREKIQ